MGTFANCTRQCQVIDRLRSPGKGLVPWGPGPCQSPWSPLQGAVRVGMREGTGTLSLPGNGAVNGQPLGSSDSNGKHQSLPTEGYKRIYSMPVLTATLSSLPLTLEIKPTFPGTLWGPSFPPVPVFAVYGTCL